MISPKGNGYKNVAWITARNLCNGYLCYPSGRSITVQVCDRGIPKLCSPVQEIELKPPPHQPLALCLTKDPPVLKVEIAQLDCDNPAYKIEDFGPNVNSVSVHDENNVDIPTHLLNGNYFICPVACGADGSVQYTAVGTGGLAGAEFSSMRPFMMVQPICPAAVFCPFWIFIILLMLYLVFFVIWIWILVGCQWLGTNHNHKRFDESAKNDRVIHVLGGHIRITKSLTLISWIFFVFTMILVILVG